MLQNNLAESSESTSEFGPRSLDSYDGQFSTTGREVSSLDRPHTNYTEVHFPDGHMEITGAHTFPSTAKSRPPSTEEEKRKRAAVRARGAVHQKAHYFGLCYLWTLTYRGPRFDRLEVLRDWWRFCRLVKRHFPEFCAVMVLEFHHGGGVNDGGFHLHFAANGFYPVQVLRACWYEVVGFGAEGQTMGQVDVSGGRSGKRSYKEIANYIAKYIVKDLETLQHEKNSHYYYQTGSLKVPRVKSRSYRGSPRSREREIYFRILFITGKVPRCWHSEDGLQFRYSTF